MSARPTPTNADYEFRTFAPKDDPETTEWFAAGALGFHDPVRSPNTMQRMLRDYQADERVLTGVYTASRPPRAWETTRPVATFSAFIKAINVGNGNSLDAQLIADVSVRSTHSRRGLLREMMAASLRRAVEEGTPLAALNASEATIYSRFGFGPSIYTRQVEVDTGEKFALRHSPEGSVEVTEPSTLLELAPEIFDRFHAQTLGSVERHAAYPSRILGLWAENGLAPDTRVRATLHYDPAGNIDGYVTYKTTDWLDDPTRTITVLDLVGATPDAYLGLWEYLASIGLTNSVIVVNASMADALQWAMVDVRGFTVTAEDDALWLRVLDPVAALEARPYDVDGEVTIALTDSLAIADGVYTVSVSNGTATVTKHAVGAAPQAEVSMDISVLGSLYFGGIRARVLARAGRISAVSDAALDTLDVLLAHKEPAYCITRF
jgi:predicted acetyltransferase